MNTLALSIALMFMIESRQGKDKSVGDGGEAVGPFQIHRIYVADTNRILALQKKSKRYFNTDRTDFKKSREMIEICSNYYGDVIRKKEHREPIWQDYCRIFHNGYDNQTCADAFSYITRIVSGYYKLAESDALRVGTEGKI